MERTKNLPIVRKKVKVSNEENVSQVKEHKKRDTDGASKVSQQTETPTHSFADPSQEPGEANSEEPEQRLGPPAEWFSADNFFVLSREEQRAREAFADDLFEDESPVHDEDEPGIPCLRPQSDSDSDSEESDDNRYQSDQDQDCDSEREDAAAAARTDTSHLVTTMECTSTNIVDQLSGMSPSREPSREPELLPAEQRGDLKAAPHPLDARDAHAAISAILKPERGGGEGIRQGKH